MARHCSTHWGRGVGKNIFVFMELTFHWRNVRMGTINKIIEKFKYIQSDGNCC